MSTDIKPGQVWAWSADESQFRIMTVDANRVRYEYLRESDPHIEGGFTHTPATIREQCRLVTDVDATPTPLAWDHGRAERHRAAFDTTGTPTPTPLDPSNTDHWGRQLDDGGNVVQPLDPKYVHIGDTVTVRFKKTGDEIVTKAYQPIDITQPGEWVFILGWPLHRPDGTFGLAFSNFEILAIEPAPRPEPKPGDPEVLVGDSYFRLSEVPAYAERLLASLTEEQQKSKDLHIAMTEIAPAPEPEPEWKPGTVAEATVRGAKGIRVIRATNTGGSDPHEMDPTWISADLVDRGQKVNGYDGTYLHHDDDVTDVRPLVVLSEEEARSWQQWKDS